MDKTNSRIGLATSIILHAMAVALFWFLSLRLTDTKPVVEEEVSSISMEMMAALAEQPEVAVTTEPTPEEKAPEKAPEPEEVIEEPKPEPVEEAIPEPKVVPKPPEKPPEKPKEKPKEKPPEKPKEKPKPPEKPKEKPKVEKPVKAIETGPEVKQGIVAKAAPNVVQGKEAKEGIANGNPLGKGNIGSANGSPNGNAASGNGNGSGNKAEGASSSDINAYRATLQRAIQRRANNTYPKREKMMRKMGTATVSFNLSPSGQISGVRVLNSSGNESLDGAAVKAVESTSVEAPPAGFPSQVTVPVKFSVE